MQYRLPPDKTSDPPAKRVSALVAHLSGQPGMIVLEALHAYLSDRLAESADEAHARRWVEAIAGVTEPIVVEVTAELARGADNPVRRDMLAKRLILLADQLANTCYVEAVRAASELQRGAGRKSALAEWATGHFFWLAHAHTARAMLDCQTIIPWEGVCRLFRDMVTHHAWPTGTTPAVGEPARSLAFLLLVHDAFWVAGETRVAAATLIASQLASDVVLAPDFHRVTPFCMDAIACEAQRRIGWEDAGKNEIALHFGLASVHQRAMALVQDAAAGQPAVWLRGVAAVDALLKELAWHWTERPGRRRHPMLRDNQMAHVAFDWRRIRGLLAQKTTRLPGADPLISRVALDDADEGGASVLLSAPDVALLAGGMLAMRVSGRWWLANPVRAEPEPDGRWFVSLRWLAQDAEPVRLTNAEGAQWRALYLHPCPANQYVPGLLLDSAGVTLSQPCVAEGTARSYQLIAERIEKLGARLYRYYCTLVPDA
jgi:hypothetical protein